MSDFELTPDEKKERAKSGTKDNLNTTSVSDNDDDDDDDDEVPTVGGGLDGILSADTLAALKEFALDSGVLLGSGTCDNNNKDGSGEGANDITSLIDSVRQHFEVQDREDVFKIEYVSKDTSRQANFELKGIKKELGQTLDSTGLTIWRAAEHLCQFIIDHPDRFSGKTTCELGAGLGLVAVLMDKLGYCDVALQQQQPQNSTVKAKLDGDRDEDGDADASLPTSLLVATDGCEDTVSLLIENKIDNGCSFEATFLYWGRNDDFLLLYPNKFEVLLAADVIYAEEQVEPLIDTVSAILKDNGEFYLAFARRNVNIQLVFTAANARGLQWEIVDEFAEGVSGVEPIYCFTWKK